MELYCREVSCRRTETAVRSTSSAVADVFMIFVLLFSRLSNFIPIGFSQGKLFENFKNAIDCMIQLKTRCLRIDFL